MIDRKTCRCNKHQGYRRRRRPPPPPTRRRGRQATINTCEEICHCHRRLQTPARRLERQQSTAEAGRTMLKRLQRRSDQKWAEENLVHNLEKLRKTGSTSRLTRRKHRRRKPPPVTLLASRTHHWTSDADPHESGNPPDTA